MWFSLWHIHIPNYKYAQLLNVWIFESSTASGWKASPNFVDSTAWKHHSHSDQAIPSTNQPVADMQWSGIVHRNRHYWKGILHISGLLTHEHPSLQFLHSDTCSWSMLLGGPTHLSTRIRTLHGQLCNWSRYHFPFSSGHPFYFTAANALTTGLHNHTISTLTPTIICPCILCTHLHYIIHARRFLPVSIVQPFFVSRVVISCLCI